MALIVTYSNKPVLEFVLSNWLPLLKTFPVPALGSLTTTLSILEIKYLEESKSTSLSSEYV